MLAECIIFMSLFLLQGATERKFQGAKGPGSELARERIGPSSIGRFAPGSELARERKRSVPAMSKSLTTAKLLNATNARSKVRSTRHNVGNRTLRTQDTSVPRHFGTSAEVSRRHFGRSAEVSRRHFGTGAEVSGQFGPKTLRHQDISALVRRHFGTNAWTLRHYSRMPLRQCARLAIRKRPSRTVKVIAIT